MKVAYLGNFAPSHSTETHLKKTLELTGWEVVPIQENFCTLPEVIEKANACDFFMWTRTKGFLPFDGFKMLAGIVVPTVSYHLDLYWGISREKDIANDPFWKTQFVFTPDGGNQLKFQAIGIKHYYLKPGVFAPECYLAEPDEKYKCDVAFVGSLNYHEEWPYRWKLLEFLGNEFGDRFKHVGNPNPTLRGHELNKFYASAKVIVGDSLCVGFEAEHYWSDRVYETLGRGGFLIHPFIHGMDEEFLGGEHLVYYRYNNWKGLKKLINQYIKQDLAREVIRSKGHKKVKAECTYTQRIQQMLEIITPKLGTRRVMLTETPRYVPAAEYISEPVPAIAKPQPTIEPACDGWRKYRGE